MLGGINYLFILCKSSDEVKAARGAERPVLQSFHQFAGVFCSMNIFVGLMIK